MSKPSIIITADDQTRAAFDAVRTSLDKVNQAAGKTAGGLDGASMSAKQLAFSTRGLPAQFTDIFVSLQAGQPPLTVLLQQGGQLKDMFGGIGPAARAMGNYVLGLANPYTVAAAAVGGLAYVYEQGARESKVFENASTMTGNAVALSASQFSAMTQSMASIVGTRGKAAEVLTEIAQTGQLAGAQVENIGTAAILMEKATGQAVSKTIEQFVKLADEPVKASAELNKSYNYLTAAVYEQIKALDEQGNKVAAANLAEQTYADAMKTRAATVVDNAGLMEKAWRGVSGAAKGAWDSMLGLGRQASLGDRLASVSAEIAKARAPFNPSAFGDGNAEARARLPANLALQASLQEMVRLEQRGTEAAAQRNQVQLAGIAGIDAVIKANERALPKQKQMEKALEDYRKSIADVRASHPGSPLLDAETIANAEKGIREQYKETAKVKKMASMAGESEVAGIRAKAEATRDYLVSLTLNGLATEKQNEAEARASKIKKELEGRISGVARANKEQALSAALAWSEDLKAVAARETLLKSQKEFEALRSKEISGQEASILKFEEKAQALEDEVAMYGRGKEAVEALTIARLEEKKVILGMFDNSAEQIALLEKEIEVRKRIAIAGDAKTGLDVAANEAKKAQAEWTKFYDSLYNGLTDSLYRAFEKGGSFFKSFWDGIKNLFKTTVLKLAIQGVVGGVTGVVAGTANAATGGGSGLLGMASNASSLYSGVSSLVTMGSQVVAGTMSVANALGTVAANATGTGISGLLAANGAYGTAAAGSASAMAGGATTALAAIPVWGWAALAAVAVASIFGGRGSKEATGGGIEGNFSGTGFAGNNFSTWKQDGGWFHNDRTGKETSALDAATAKQFTDAYGAVKTSAAMAAVSLGLSADAITGYSQSISLQLGSDAAANEKAVAALFAGIGDNMALAAAPGIALLSKEGEAAGATMARLSISLTTANAWLSMLRQRLFQVGLAGGDAASKLADTFGGLEQMGSAVQAYYELYFTEAEKAATSTNQMTAALAAVGVAMPTTKDAFRAVAEGLDLNTESGRLAYATLLAIAPQFSQTSDAMADMATESAAAAAAAVAEASRLAQELSAKLLDAFSGRQQLIPLLSATLGRFDALSNGLDGAAGSALDMGNATGWINVLLGQASSGLLFFGDHVAGLDQPLSGAQLAALSLTDQIINLKLNAGRTVTDIAGLSAALANVNTETFMMTMDGVLKRLGEMFQGVLGDIASERIATREAALAIINPTVMSKDQIQRGIAGANVGMPSNAGLVAANNHVAYVDGLVAARKASLASVQSQTVSTAALDAAKSAVVSRAALDSASGALGAANARLSSADAAVANFRAYGNGNFNYFMDMAYAGHDLRGSVPNPSGERNAQNTVFEQLAARAAQQPAQSNYNDQLWAYNQAEAQKQQAIANQQAAYNQAKAAHDAVLAPIQNYLSELINLHLPWALQDAQKAQTAYIDSLQNYAIDASKATAKLGKLREETVKYYESQKALADLMAKSAGTLRQTVADYRYSQLTPEQQFRSLETQYNTAYSMALSTSGDTLAGYADQMSGLLGPLMDKMQEAGYDSTGNQSFIAAMLARAEAVATRVDALTPTNYAADSLAMLGQIDTTLAALEVGSKSAERIIADAINLGRDQTVNGLRQVVHALTGQGVAAFAAGGMHAGGLRLVGENGPELEVTGPSRIFSASQTRSMLGGAGGDTARLEALVERLVQDNANMRAELRAIASSNAGLLRMAQRAEVDGTLVRTEADTPLATVVAA